MPLFQHAPAVVEEILVARAWHEYPTFQRAADIYMSDELRIQGQLQLSKEEIQFEKRMLKETLREFKTLDLIGCTSQTTHVEQWQIEQAEDTGTHHL
jgi:hypothetical protein